LTSRLAGENILNDGANAKFKSEAQFHFEMLARLFSTLLPDASPPAQRVAILAEHAFQKSRDFRGTPLALQFIMKKSITLLLAFAIIAGSFALFRRSVTHASVRPTLSDMTCGDEYNALVVKAKQSLMHGDRAGAITGLLDAQKQLHHCEELEERNASAPHSVVLNSFQPLTDLALR
jgi:hypothetical protein